MNIIDQLKDEVHQILELQQETLKQSRRKMYEAPIKRAEAMKFLKFGKTKFQELLNNDMLPCYRVPGSDELRFYESELSEWVKGKRRSKLRKV